MFFRYLIILFIFTASALCSASDGVIRFTGRVVEPTCVVTTDKTDTATEVTKLNTCSKHVASSTTVTTQVVTPDSNMVPWRANITAKPDQPVTQWKLIQVTYL